MTNAQTLTRHRDVQEWISARRGLPAMQRVPSSTGQMQNRLAIRFDHPHAAPKAASVDDGVMPVSWSAWLAEFDRQGLMLKVTNKAHYEFVRRRDLN